MLKLLGRKTSGNVQKVVFLLEELGLPYEREDYGRQFGNTGGAYLRLNPNAKVPTLIDGELVVWESNTILRYLSARAGGALLPADPAARSHVERWMDWQLGAVNPFYMAVFLETKKPAEERAAAVLEQAGGNLGTQLAILDADMGADGGARAWIAGPSMSLADICLGPIVHRCLGFPVELPALDNLRRWRERLAERPAFGRAVDA